MAVRAGLSIPIEIRIKIYELKDIKEVLKVVDEVKKESSSVIEAVIELDTGMNFGVVEKILERADEAAVLKCHATKQEIEAAIRQTRAETGPVIKRGCSDRSFFRNLSEKEGTETGEFRKCLQAVGIENEKADSFMSAFRNYFFMPPEVEWQKYMREWVKEICPELMEQYLRAEQEFTQSWKGYFEENSHQADVQ